MKIPHWFHVVAFLFSMAFLFGCGMAGSSGSGNSNGSGLTITTATLPDATIDQSYSSTLQASGGTAPYSWSVSSGSLPTGLSLTTAGEITGTPTKMGSYSFQVQVVDKTQRSSSGHVAVKVTGPTPSISGISPAYGATAGGTMVTINGKNLQSGATVTFDGLAGTSVNVTNSNQMTTVTPAHAAGSVDVVVTNPGGKSATLFAGFGYGSAAPSVSAISPNTGPTTGGTTVKITGSNFVAGALVFFGTVAATGINVSSATQIQAITPSVSTAAAVNVEVQNSDGQSGSVTNGFTYTDPPSNSSPSVSDVSPSTTSAGTDVTVNGTNFASGATVNIGSTAASNVQFLSSTQLTATVPSVSPGTYDVTVANTNGLSATLSPGLTVADPVSGDLLSGCTVSSSNQPVCGSNDGSAAIPAGWTLVAADGFDTKSLANSSKESLVNAAIQCTTAHTGSCALSGTYSAAEQKYYWILAQGAIGSSHEVYVSWWQMDTSGETFGNNNYVAHFDGADGDGGSGHETLSIDDWLTGQGSPACLNGTDANGNPSTSFGAYNCQNSTYLIEDFFADGSPTTLVAYGKTLPFPTSWSQFEIHYKANTSSGGTPNSDGDVELYKNGQVILSASGDLNKLSTMNGMQVQLGSFFEQRDNYTSSAYTTCAAYQSTSYWHFLTPFSSAAPCPVPPDFTKYWDDVIVLKK